MGYFERLMDKTLRPTTYTPKRDNFNTETPELSRDTRIRAEQPKLRVTDAKQQTRMGVPAYQKSVEAERIENSRKALLQYSQEDAERMDNIKCNPKLALTTSPRPKQVKSREVATGRKALENLKQSVTPAQIIPHEMEGFNKARPNTSAPHPRRPTKSAVIEQFKSENVLIEKEGPRITQRIARADAHCKALEIAALAEVNMTKEQMDTYKQIRAIDSNIPPSLAIEMAMR